MFNQVADRIDEVEQSASELIETKVNEVKMPIVESENALKKLDVKNGSLASVLGFKSKERSLRELYQLSFGDIIREDLSRCTDIEDIIIKYPSVFPIMEGIFMAMFSASDTRYFTIGFGVQNNVNYVIVDTRDGTELPLYVNGVYYQEGHDYIREELSSYQYNYVFAMDPLGNIGSLVDYDIIDQFITCIATLPTADVYIKGNTWEQLAKKDDVGEYVVSSEEELNALSVENGTIAKVVSGSRIVGSFNSLAVGDRVYDVEFMQPPYASGSCSVMFKDKDGNDIGFGVDSNGTECQFGLVTRDSTIIFGNEKGINQDLYNQAITIFKEKECTFEWVDGKLPVDSFVRPVTNTPVVSNAYIKGETWTRLLKEGDVTGGDSKSVLFYMPLNDGLSDIQKQTNAESYKKIVDGFKNNVYYNVKVFGLYAVIDATVVGNALLTEGRIALMFDMLNTWQVMEVLEDGSATVEEVDAWKGCEIREFYIGDSLTDQQKAWNLETAMMVEEKKCTTVFKVNAPINILPAGTTIPLSAFVDRTFLYVFSSGVNAAFVSVTIDSDGNSDITAESVSTDNALSSTSTNAVQNKVVTNALNNKADKTYVEEKVGEINSILDSINEEVI